MRKLNSREKILFYIAAAVVAAWPAGTFFIIPAKARFVRVQKEIYQSQLRAKEYQLIQAREKELQPFLNNAALAQKNDARPGDKPAEVLKDLENLSRTAGLKLNDVRPIESGDKKKQNEITVELKAEGTMAAVSKFLYDLESPLEATAVKKLQLNAKSGDILSVNLVVVKLIL